MTPKYLKRSGMLVLALAGLSGVAHATNWTYTANNTSFAVGGLTATAAAYANSGLGGTTLTATLGTYGTNGLGVSSGTDGTNVPYHAIDNNQYVDSVLFSFDNGVSGNTSADKVNLSAINIGYVGGSTVNANRQNDADFSVYAYTGASAMTLAGLKYSTLTANGWTLVGNYSNSTTGTKSLTSPASGNGSGSAGIYSSYWLVAAYTGLGTGFDTTNDFFKVAYLTGANCPTTGTLPAGCTGGSGGPSGAPEPGTIFLMGAGLFGISRISRRPAAK